MRRTSIWKLLLAVSVLAAQPSTAYAADPSASERGGDALRGKVLYQACLACHSIEDNDLGPRHRGVVGRHAGSVADYNYSLALKTSGLTWDRGTLDRWLTNPSALVPGTKMFFLIDAAQDRADVIAYLASLQ